MPPLNTITLVVPRGVRPAACCALRRRVYSLALCRFVGVCRCFAPYKARPGRALREASQDILHSSLRRSPQASDAGSDAGWRRRESGPRPQSRNRSPANRIGTLKSVTYTHTYTRGLLSRAPAPTATSQQVPPDDSTPQGRSVSPSRFRSDAQQAHSSCGIRAQQYHYIAIRTIRLIVPERLSGTQELMVRSRGRRKGGSPRVGRYPDEVRRARGRER